MASLKIISFNPDHPQFLPNGEYRDFLRSQLFQIGVDGVVDVIAFQEPHWALTQAAAGIYFGMGVHGDYQVYSSSDAREAALFVRKTSEWKVVSFYGLRYDEGNNNVVTGSPDMITPLLNGYIPAPRHASVRKRLVVVQLRSGTREVTIASYHGLQRISNEDNRIINDGLLKGCLWMSSFLRDHNNACWPIVLAADFNAPAIMELGEGLDSELRDRGLLYIPTLERVDDDGNPIYLTNPGCIDGFFVASSRKAVCVSSRAVEMGAEIIDPQDYQQLGRHNNDLYYSLVRDNPEGPPSVFKHNHVAYKLNLLVATSAEVYGALFPPPPPPPPPVPPSPPPPQALAPAAESELADHFNQTL